MTKNQADLTMKSSEVRDYPPYLPPPTTAGPGEGGFAPHCTALHRIAPNRLFLFGSSPTYQIFVTWSTVGSPLSPWTVALDPALPKNTVETQTNNTDLLSPAPARLRQWDSLAPVTRVRIKMDYLNWQRMLVFLAWA